MKTAKQMTLGSLFDGIGGFPLAGKYAGIRPVWASEIEPFPIRVTEKRLPEMKHYGDIHTLHGAQLEPVDVITFGSPCQSFSVAGNRQGLEGCSSLFFEAVRIIREMREATNGKKPGWAVWENVPGAMSSHDGEDYRQVLESLVRIKDPEADVPLPAGGRWLPAGEIMGDGYSLAWRILDAAQGWGVAQRRKRIFAVFDLDGQCAGEVLFESEGVSGYTPPSIKARQGTAGGAAQGAGETGNCLKCPNAGIDNKNMPLVFGISSDQSNAMLSDNPHTGVYEAQTCRTLDCNCSSAACNQGGMVVVEPTYALTTGEYTVLGREQTPPLMARDYKDPMIVNTPAYALDRACFTSGENAQYTMNIREEVAPTLVAEGPAAVAEKEQAYLVRRLTPLECCRLQGFPDGWTENLGTEEPGEQEIARWVGVFEDWYRAQGKATRASPVRVTKWLKDPHNDAAQYKAYGNSVAVPCVFFVLAGIVWAEERGDET